MKYTYHFSKDGIEKVYHDFKKLADYEIREKYGLKSDSSGWNLAKAKKTLTKEFNKENIRPINYRPFDVRFTYFSKEQGFLGRPRYKLLRHLIDSKNYALTFTRKMVSNQWQHIFVTDKITESCFVSIRTREKTYIAPLYLYPINSDNQPNVHNHQETVNFKKSFLKYIKQLYKKEPAPEQILSYLYAVMHCPIYRTRYLDFLKIDFPRIPFFPDYSKFSKMAELGSDLIEHHLMKKSYPDSKISFPEKGDDTVKKVSFEQDKDKHTGNVFINAKQYFGNVSVVAWDFEIGGYKVLDRWLKSRKDRVLKFQEKETFNNIVNILGYTDRAMANIAKVWEG